MQNRQRSEKIERLENQNLYAAFGISEEEIEQEKY